MGEDLHLPAAADTAVEDPAATEAVQLLQTAALQVQAVIQDTAAEPVPAQRP